MLQVVFDYFFLSAIMSEERKSENNKIYCFDFDGTIADTLPLIVKTVDSLLKKYNEEEISVNTLRKMREGGIEEMIKESKTPVYKLILLYPKIKKNMNKGLSDVKISEDMRAVLMRLKKEGCTLGIITSNSKKNVTTFLKENDLNIFSFINSCGLFGKSRVIKKLKNKEKGGIFIYIGDEPRDIIAGRKANVKTVAVPWGLSSKSALLCARPDVLIEKPDDLLNLSF